MHKILPLLLVPSVLFASIDAETKAPSGSATVGVPTVGKAYFAYEVRNDADSTIKCRVVRRACMDNLQNCVENEQVHVILKKGRVRDYGSYLSVPATYQSAREYYTTSYIDFYDCGMQRKHVSAESHYHVRNY